MNDQRENTKPEISDYTSIYEIIVSNHDIKKMDSKDRVLFLAFGHGANEITALYRAACAAAMDVNSNQDAITRMIAQSQTLLMLRLVASKIYEVIILSNKGNNAKLINQIYPGFKQVRKDVNNLIGKYMSMEMLRNKFGFHYSDEIYADDLRIKELPDNNYHSIVINRKGPNCYFSISDYFFQLAFADSLKERTTMREFADKIIPAMSKDYLIAVDKFIIGIHHLMIGIGKKNRIDLNDSARHQQASVAFTAIQDTRLPAFILFGRGRKEKS